MAAYDMWGEVPFGTPHNFKNKTVNIRYYIQQFLARTNRMYKYEGLPTTMPARNIEMLLQSCGGIVVGRVDERDGGGVWAFPATLGGKLNRYLLPREAIVTNSTLHKSYTFTVNADDPAENDAVLILNDSGGLGLMPLYRRYATLIAENDLTIWILDVVSRAQALISAGDSNTQKGADEWIKKLVAGDISACMDNAFIESLHVQPFSGAVGSITEKIELAQYLRAGLWNDIGLTANYNMKREAINSTEAQLGQDALLPMVDDMTICREEGWQKVNDLFGLDVRVSLAGAWELRQEAAEEEPAEEKEVPEDDDQPSDPRDEGDL